MKLEEAKRLLDRSICVRVEHTPEDAQRLGRRFEEICGKVLRIEREGDYYWIVFDWGWGVRLDGIIEYWNEEVAEDE